MTFKIKLLIKHMNLFEGCADEAIDCFKNCPIKSIE